MAYNGPRSEQGLRPQRACKSTYQNRRSIAMIVRGLCILGVVLSTSAVRGGDEKPLRPAEEIQLFNGKDLTGLTTWLKGEKRKDPDKVFTAHDGMIHISGETN